MMLLVLKQLSLLGRRRGYLGQAFMDRCPGETEETPMRSMKNPDATEQMERLNKQLVIVAATKGLVILRSFSLHLFLSETHPLAKAEMQAGLISQRLDESLPRLVVDMYGYILLLYIPRFWDVRSRNILRNIIRDLEAVAPPTEDEKQSKDARVNPTDAKMGRITRRYHWAAAWHATGHHTDSDPLAFKPAKELLEPADPKIFAAKLKFLRRKGPADARISHMLSLVYPSLTPMFGQLRQELARQRSPISEIMAHWRSSFPAMCIAFDRTTKRHRDVNGCTHGVDVLYPLGDFSGGDFHLPDLGISFAWTPGCLAALDGRTFTHEIKEWKGSERVVVIDFLRRFILDHLGVAHPENASNVFDLQFLHPHLDLSLFHLPSL